MPEIDQNVYVNNALLRRVTTVRQVAPMKARYLRTYFCFRGAGLNCKSTTNYDTPVTISNSDTPVIRSSQYRPTRTREITVYKCVCERVTLPSIVTVLVRSKYYVLVTRLV